MRPMDLRRMNNINRFVQIRPCEDVGVEVEGARVVEINVSRLLDLERVEVGVTITRSSVLWIRRLIWWGG
jgi:hypothetical protein